MWMYLRTGILQRIPDQRDVCRGGIKELNVVVSDRGAGVAAPAEDLADHDVWRDGLRSWRDQQTQDSQERVPEESTAGKEDPFHSCRVYQQFAGAYEVFVTVLPLWSHSFQSERSVLGDKPERRQQRRSTRERGLRWSCALHRLSRRAVLLTKGCRHLDAGTASCA